MVRGLVHTTGNGRHRLATCELAPGGKTDASRNSPDLCVIYLENWAPRTGPDNWARELGPRTGFRELGREKSIRRIWFAFPIETCLGMIIAVRKKKVLWLTAVATADDLLSSLEREFFFTGSFSSLGANWIRPGSLKCKWRVVVDQWATLKADQISYLPRKTSQWPPSIGVPGCGTSPESPKSR